ncbi:homoserine O-acetyltransferase/O-succinyltransferase family protein [Clostridium mediterraneense]|uniref:homoserine O-acetyltransferase/O-succinyltransferase family protein n=1 Tax=Clostridium mediterraneense TaxID=1805472 RepID=UPI00082CB3A7|nr:homoserine O-succinyltransferase [Clostridium mediterraneense]
MTIYLSKNLNGILPLSKDFDIKVVEDKQDIKTIGVLNLMPTKCETETQILRLLCETRKELKVEFIRLDSYKPKNIPYEYIVNNYRSFSEVKESLDLLIVTGAPLEKLEFNEVDYIDELREVLDYTKLNIEKSLYICWGAQVALNHFYSIRKRLKNEKIFGLFSHEILNGDKILSGIEGGFKAPHSRHTSLVKEDLDKCNKLKQIAKTQEGEDFLLKGEFNDYYILGHIEYDKDTLKNEYLRDIKKGLKINKPRGYFINDNIDEGINFNWREDAIKFYKNLID